MRHALLALLLAAPAAAQTAAAPPAAVPKVSEPEKLGPLEAVRGCGERRLPTARRPALSAGAWRAMLAYHQARGGIGLLVLRDGRVEREAYARGMGTATRTMSQSMAKSVTALALGQAVADGVAPGPDAPLRDFLDAPADKGGIPLRAFLTMSSGLKNPARGDPAGGRMMFGPGITEAALSLPVEKPFDTEFRYNNANSQIVGAALAAGLAEKGETSKSNFASLADRVATGTNTPQRFGTQGTCAGAGDWRPHPIADEASVDERRRWAGIRWTMAEYRKEMNGHCH